MNAAYGTLALQVVAVALCACGIAVILGIAALAGSAVISGSSAELQLPHPVALAGVWLALSAQLACAWILERS